MALFVSGSRRRSLKSVLRDATVVLAGTLLGILLSHMFFNDKGSERGIADLERLCADGGNARLLHLTKRSDDKSRDRPGSRMAMRLQRRPLPTGWGAVRNGIKEATGRERGMLAGGGEERDGGGGGGSEAQVSSSGSGETTMSYGSGHSPSTKQHLEGATSQTTNSLVPLHVSSNGLLSKDERIDSDLLTLENPTTNDYNSDLHDSLMIGVHVSDLDGYAAVGKTWESYAQKIVYFSSMKERGLAEEDAPVITLSQEVDDDRHSRRSRSSSYQVLKYIHDNFKDNFGWFMRTSDKVYVQVDHLTNYLARFDPNLEHCFGYVDSGGQNTNTEAEQYNVEGPVTIFSRGLLQKLGPHLEKCLVNVTNTSKDVDVWRCLRDRVAFKCGTKSEISQLFMTDHSDGEIFVHPDPHTAHQLLQSLVVYPVHSAPLMFKLHQFYLESAIDGLKSRTNQLISELERLTSLTRS